MEYQKRINFLDDTANQPSNFRTRNSVETNDESKETYDNRNLTVKMSMITSNFCDYSDPYILFREIITVPNTAAADAVIKNSNKKVTFQNCAPFTDCITEVNNTQVVDAQKLIQ